MSIARISPRRFTGLAGLVALALIGAADVATARELAQTPSAPPAGQGRAGRRVIPPPLSELALQPFSLHAQRIAEALEKLGAPLSADALAAIAAARAKPDDAELAERVVELLESRVVFVLTINPEGRITPSLGGAAGNGAPGNGIGPTLDEFDARVLLVRVENGCGSTSPLTIESPQAPIDMLPSERAAHAETWLEIEPYYGAFLRRELVGISREYRVVALAAHASGKRAATFTFDHRQASQTQTSPNALDVVFDVIPSVPLTLGVKEENGTPAVAGFVVRDERGGVHPSPALRHDADFRFHPQVYRGDGEELRLTPGRYTIEVTHGPETLVERRELSIEAKKPARADFTLRRWIDPAARGWFSGDPHIHAAGCAHFRTPGVGAAPEHMLRQTRGEDVKVGDCLTWGVGWDHQHQFFSGKTDPRSVAPYFLRYDVEVSGFGSHKSGHLVLLGLREQFYPGTKGIDGWPNLSLPILSWAKKQGALCGTAHSGLGLAVDSDALPCDVVPPFDNIGANAFVVDVTHEVEAANGARVCPIDLYGVGNTPWPWELNLWYRTLDVGFRPKLAGETDFPCLIDERVGGSRTYVKVDGALDVERWFAGLAAGRSYVGDGRSHLIDVRAAALGTSRSVALGESDLELERGGIVDVSAKAAALLPEVADASIASRKWTETPYWHLERARIRGTREVDVECIVNGRAVAKQRLVCDGKERELHFQVPIERSSWIALRVLPSCHTNPMFVTVAGAPVRASAASAEFLLKCVDRCWEQKSRFYTGPGELDAGAKAYEHARAVYRARATEARASGG